MAPIENNQIGSAPLPPPVVIGTSGQQPAMVTLNIGGQVKAMPRPRIIGTDKRSKLSAPLARQANQRDSNKPRCVDVFRILSQIGEGTYGQVYKAKDTDGT